MRVHIVDPSAFTPPYDHALCRALARAGAEVDLVTSRFAYDSVPEPDGYAVRELFYRRARGAAGSWVRRAAKLAEHVPDMVRYRRIARLAEVVHFQWLDIQWLDRFLLPDRPTVLTAHDLLPREPRPGQASAQRRLYAVVDALVVHSEYGRAQLVEALSVDPAKVHVIHHGAFEHLATLEPHSLPRELEGEAERVVLFFGLLRPYKGIETLLDAWRGIDGAVLWVVGRPRMPLAPLRARSPHAVRFVPRFVSDGELAALFRRADVIALPYARTDRFDQSGVLATALAFGKAIVVSDVGGFREVAAAGAAQLVPPDDPAALHVALADLLAEQGQRERLASGALAAARGPYSWGQAARKTLALYRTLA